MKTTLLSRIRILLVCGTAMLSGVALAQPQPDELKMPADPGQPGIPNFGGGGGRRGARGTTAPATGPARGN